MLGMNQGWKGKGELKRALSADPDLQLDDDFATPALRKAFKELGGHDAKPPPGEQTRRASGCAAGADDCDEEPKAEQPESRDSPSEPPATWLSLHLEQDFLIYSSKDPVCARSNVPGSVEAPGYACFRGGSQFGYTSGQDIAPGPGNRISGGVGRATTRALLGFDRLLGPNFSLGLRFGFAFGGSPTSPRHGKFQPLHAELRVNYWLGNEPFRSSAVRPFVSLSGGFAEVDGRVAVEYFDGLGNLRQLDAWRKTGKGFAGLGVGAMIPIGRTGLLPEIRAFQLFGQSGTGFDLSLGYAYGF